MDEPICLTVDQLKEIYYCLLDKEPDKAGSFDWVEWQHCISTLEGILKGYLEETE